MPTVALDFDGVIHRYSKGWHDGTIYDEPMPGAIEGLRKLQERYAVYVYTSRAPLTVAIWLGQLGLTCALDPGAAPAGSVEAQGEPAEFWTDQEIILVTDRKLPAFAYVDDRAVVFTSWGQLGMQLDGARDGNFGPPCCPWHGRRCEHGEYCCQICPEVDHGRRQLHGGRGRLLCSAPDLSGDRA